MSEAYQITELVAVISLAAAFSILYIDKVGIRDQIILKAPSLISKLFSCDFCLSFWVSLAFAILLAILFNEIIIIFVSVLATPITRILI